jgi:hypothetical protein
VFYESADMGEGDRELGLDSAVTVRTLRVSVQQQGPKPVKSAAK